MEKDSGRPKNVLKKIDLEKKNVSKASKEVKKRSEIYEMFFLFN